MTIKNDLQALIKEAQDPNTESKRLREIWLETTSSRVRKSVAGNPNSDTRTLCMASRLYIKEVMENSSLPIRNLFSEEPEIKFIMDAYSNPDEFMRDNKLRSATKAKSAVVRAILISPNLKEWRTVYDLLSHMSSSEFVRELKDKDVNRRVGKIIISNLSSFPVYSLVYFLKNKIINIAEFSYALDRRRPDELNVSKKNFLNIFKSIRDQTDYETIFKFINVSSTYCLRNLFKSLSDEQVKNYMFTDECFADLVNLYKDFLVLEVSSFRGRHSYHTWGESKKSFHLSKIIWEGIKFRCCLNENSVDFNCLFKDIQLAGFDLDFGPYKCPINLGNNGSAAYRSDICKKLMEINSDYAFEFFMTCGILWKTWYAKCNPCTFESQVVDRMHEINRRKNFKYYRYSNLSYHPTFDIMVNNGVYHVEETYYDSKSKLKLTGSGILFKSPGLTV